MPQTLTVLPAEKADLPLLAQIAIDAEASRHIPDMRFDSKDEVITDREELICETVKQLAKDFFCSHHDIFKVVTEDNDILGFYGCGPDPFIPDAALLTDYYTIPSPHKPGRALMDFCVNKLQQENKQEIVLVAMSYAIPIYEHFGFRFTNEDMNMHLRLSEYRPSRSHARTSVDLVMER